MDICDDIQGALAPRQSFNFISHTNIKVWDLEFTGVLAKLKIRGRILTIAFVEGIDSHFLLSGKKFMQARGGRAGRWVGSGRALIPMLGQLGEW